MEKMSIFGEDKKKTIATVVVNIHEDGVVIADSLANSFLLADVYGAIRELGKDYTVVCIQNFDMEQSRKYDALDHFASQFSQETLIVTTAYVSTKEFPEDKYYLYKGEEIEGKEPLPLDETLAREGSLLAAVGFVNINSYVRYENKWAYVYGNAAGRTIAKYLMDNKELIKCSR